MATCVCGHDKPEHLVGLGKCFAPQCECEQFRQAFTVNIRTMMDNTGDPRVILEFMEAKLQLTSSAACQIALELLSAGYAARGEKALYDYALSHDLDIQELLKFVRTQEPHND